MNPRFAYIVTGEEGKKDIYVRSQDLASAVHGDTVEVVSTGRKSGITPKANSYRYRKTGSNSICWPDKLSRNFGFVVPDFKKIYQDFFIYPENLNGATANDKVLFEVTKWCRSG
ncbi:MAG: hypothetical protein U5K54_10815 [Cytophagales bacterium]|nr:hypothetical protein [Cytophagales bacterium]